MKHTSIIDDSTITHDHHFIFVARIISYIGSPMSATTTGLIPLNALMTYSLSLNWVKNIAIRRMIRNGGRQLPIVATTLPAVPRNLCPVRIEIFAANSPGAACARAMISRNSSSPIHPLLVSSLLMAAIIGIPPPMVKAPILLKTRNMSQSDTDFCIFPRFGHKSRKNIKKKLKKFGG